MLKELLWILTYYKEHFYMKNSKSILFSWGKDDFSQQDEYYHTKISFFLISVGNLYFKDTAEVYFIQRWGRF